MAMLVNLCAEMKRKRCTGAEGRKVLREWQVIRRKHNTLIMLKVSQEGDEKPAYSGAQNVEGDDNGKT